MRLLHVVASDERRGAEIFASQLVASLAGRGVDQHVAVLRAGPPGGIGFQAPVITLPDGEGRLGALPLDPRKALGLARIRRQGGPVVLIAHGGEPLKYLTASAWGRPVPSVYRRIGDERQFRGSRIREGTYGWMMRRATRVVTVAEVLRHRLVRRSGLDPAGVVSIPNAVDPSVVRAQRSRKAIRAELGIPAGASVVLSLGALTWEKDPLAQVDVVARAAANRPIAHLIAGDGPLRSELERAVAGPVRNYVPRLLGSRPDVGDLLSVSDVLVLASRTEGMPACVIEAGLAGIPVVAYSLSGVPEVVVDGSTGRLVPPGHRDGLAQALIEVLADKPLRARMGERAVERCRERFDIDVVAARYLDVFEEVAASAKGAVP